MMMGWTFHLKHVSQMGKERASVFCCHIKPVHSSCLQTEFRDSSTCFRVLVDSYFGGLVNWNTSKGASFSKLNSKVSSHEVAINVGVL